MFPYVIYSVSSGWIGLFLYFLITDFSQFVLKELGDIIQIVFLSLNSNNLQWGRQK